MHVATATNFWTQLAITGFWLSMGYTYGCTTASDRLWPAAKFTLRASLGSSYIAGVTAMRGTRAVGVTQTLRHGIFTRHGGHPVRHWAIELSSSN